MEGDGKRMDPGLPEEQLSLPGQQGLDLYQYVQAAPCVSHFILHTKHTKTHTDTDEIGHTIYNINKLLLNSNV